MPNIVNLPKTEALIKLRELKKKQAMMPGYESIKPSHVVESFMSNSRETADVVPVGSSPRLNNRSKSKLHCGGMSVGNSMLSLDTSKITLSGDDSESDYEEGQNNYLPPFSRTHIKGAGNGV